MSRRLLVVAALTLLALRCNAQDLSLFESLPVLMSTTSVPGSAHVPGDFNGDGVSDLLWFNPSTSQLSYWRMSFQTGAGAFKLGENTFNVSPGYVVGAVGDLDGNGYADLVFTSASRDLWLWKNNRQGGWSSTRIGDYPAAWKLVGAGDINGDGYDDLLWMDDADCQFAYWTMRGGVRTGSRVVKVACGYYPVGVGYYSPSNRISILWTSPAKDLYVWDSRATGFAAYNLTSHLPGSSMDSVWAIGGGYEGGGGVIGVGGGSPIGIERREAGGNNSEWDLLRWFDASGAQSEVHRFNDSYSYAVDQLSSAGYLKAGRFSALYTVDMTNSWLGISVLGKTNAPSPFKSTFSSSWTFSPGWYVVGAAVNNSP